MGTDMEAVIGRDSPEEEDDGEEDDGEDTSHKYCCLRNLGLYLLVRCSRPEGTCICAKLSTFQVRDRSWTFGHAQLN